MNDKHWKTLLEIIEGKNPDIIPAGFIIDSPWLPDWVGISKLDYFTSDELWFQSNQKAIDTFPELMFFPGYWAEFGMCTEPSAFGCSCSWDNNELPFAAKIIHQLSDIDALVVPDPQKDGLSPLLWNRLQRYRPKIEKTGHALRFAVARGPMNVASFLMGTTEFLMALRSDPEKIHKLLQIVTEYLFKSIVLQKKMFDSIEGIFILDDIVGFCGEPDVAEFACPYLTKLFSSFDAKVKLFHNDANGQSCASHLKEMGVNVFNFSFMHSLEEMKNWTNNQVVLLGNIPPRDVLANGSPEQVSQSVKSALGGINDRRRIILSCGGGMPDAVSTENIRAFVSGVQNLCCV